MSPFMDRLLNLTSPQAFSFDRMRSGDARTENREDVLFIRNRCR